MVYRGETAMKVEVYRMGENQFRVVDEETGEVIEETDVLLHALVCAANRNTGEAGVSWEAYNAELDRLEKGIRDECTGLPEVSEVVPRGGCGDGADCWDQGNLF